MEASTDQKNFHVIMKIGTLIMCNKDRKIIIFHSVLNKIYIYES